MIEILDFTESEIHQRPRQKIPNVIARIDHKDITRNFRKKVMNCLIATAGFLLPACSSQQQIPFPPENSDCQLLQGQGGIKVKEGEMKTIPFQVCPNHTYTACTDHPVGNPDLVGSILEINLGKFGPVSADKDIITILATGEKQSRPDCIIFQTDKADEFHVAVVGGKNQGQPSETNVWMTGAPLQSVPLHFEHALSWFSDTCTEVTGQYGVFGGPWGNEGNTNRPFYNDDPIVNYVNYLHGGEDFKCPKNTSIKAPCSGEIIENHDAGGDWGWDTNLQCEKEGQFLTISFIHLNQASLKPAGTHVEKGQEIGTVIFIDPTKILDEPQHVHVTFCAAKYQDCQSIGFQPDRGACARSQWLSAVSPKKGGYWLNPDPYTNPGLYKNPPLKH